VSASSDQRYGYISIIIMDGSFLHGPGNTNI